MILILSAVAILAVGIALVRLSPQTEILGLICSVVSGLVLVILLITLPLCRCGGRESLARLQACRVSIQRARNDKTLSDVERAAILSQIANWNEWLASERYWKGGFLDLWHVDEVMTTEDLK